MDQSRGQIRTGAVYKFELRVYGIKSLGHDMIRLQSSHHGSCKMPFIYGLPTQMANLARSLVFCLLLLECCFPSWQLNMASRACVATEALSSVSFGLFDCCCHLLGLLRPLRRPLFLACGKSPGKWAVLKKKEALFFLFFDCFPSDAKFLQGGMTC